MSLIKDALNGVDIDQIIKKSVSDSVKSQTKGLVAESYVAEPKSFKQVSERLSQKTKDAHTELYSSYITSLNTVSSKLDTVERNSVDYRSSDFSSLKKNETFNLNAKWLHELYFANCFDPHSEISMDTKSFMKLQRDFGSFDDWQKDFMACAFAAGEGWAVCAYSIHLQRYVNTVINGHSDNVMMGLYPIIVVDMWSHAYYKDYLDDKESYLISQLREINWTVVEDRVNVAEAIAGVIK